MELEKHIKHVPGRNMGDIFLFALSTCVWCKRTKRLFEELGVEYKYVDVDLLDGPARIEALREMHRWDKSQAFPLIIINGRSVSGFKESVIRDLLGE